MLYVQPNKFKKRTRKELKKYYSIDEMPVEIVDEVMAAYEFTDLFDFEQYVEEGLIVFENCKEFVEDLFEKEDLPLPNYQYWNFDWTEAFDYDKFAHLASKPRNIEISRSGRVLVMLAFAGPKAINSRF
ncbi:hypothetical protein [Pseudolactococcus insecticola]|uniref:Uncharacterized protein n=1 Tax=Pseudolactococcus insecticola TaxID=2709158 RepID=A0A6A0B7M3_9LACT|nr:hypothetical protein [Lactococcus insecticola]GFH41419.1 hypothetical protein Hs20B_18170 [Lactococcus insecticola]